MRKIYTIAFILLVYAGTACADEVGERLGSATEQIRNATRQMIQAGIETGEAIGMTQTMLTYRFDHQQMEQAQEMLTQAVRAGLPPEPIVSKAYEGMAKKVPSDTIVQAMESVKNRYAHAYRQARFLTSETDRVRSLGTLIADTLSAGMEPEDMEIVRTRLQERIAREDRDHAGELAEETLRTARAIARLGTSSTSAADVMVQALMHEYTAQDMASLRKAFISNAGQRAAETLAKSYAAQIGEGKSAQGLGSSSPGGSGSGAGNSGGGGGGGGNGGSGGGSGNGGQ